MCAADSRSAPPHNTSAPSVTSVAVSSVHEITSGAPTHEAALSATRVCVTRSNEWFDIAVSADRSSDSEATLQWYSVHSDSCARIHMPLLCQLTGVVNSISGDLAICAHACLQDNPGAAFPGERKACRGCVKRR